MGRTLSQRQSAAEPRSTKNSGVGLHDLGVPVCAQVCVFAPVGLFVALAIQILFSLPPGGAAPPLTSQPSPHLLPSFLPVPPAGVILQFMVNLYK